MNIFSLLEHVDSTENEQILIHFIKESPEQFVKMNAKDISKQCYISSSTIYRLCQKLQLSGLSELKLQVSASLPNYLQEKRNFDYNYPIKKNQTQYQITHQLKDVYEQTVISTLKYLDLDQLRYIVHQMKKTHKIDIYTSAGNIYFALNFQFQMQEIGIHVNVPIEEYQQRLCASCSDQTHLAIVISFGGRGVISKRVMKILKENHTPIVLIGAPHNPLEKDADYTLYMNPYENHYDKISSFSTRLSLLYILDCLYTCYFELDYDHNVQKKRQHYYQLSGLKRQE